MEMDAQKIANEIVTNIIIEENAQLMSLVSASQKRIYNMIEASNTDESKTAEFDALGKEQWRFIRDFNDMNKRFLALMVR